MRTGLRCRMGWGCEGPGVSGVEGGGGGVVPAAGHVDLAGGGTRAVEGGGVDGCGDVAVLVGDGQGGAGAVAGGDGVAVGVSGECGGAVCDEVEFDRSPNSEPRLGDSVDRNDVHRITRQIWRQPADLAGRSSGPDRRAPSTANRRPSQS